MSVEPVLELCLAVPDPGGKGKDEAELLTLLSGEERQRYQALVRASDRRAYLWSHAMLRTALSRHAPTDPGEWVFEEAEGGKPRLAGPKGSDLEFSLSHTGEFAACVISNVGPVGVDIERLSRGEAVLEVAQDRFAPEERDALLGLPRAQRGPAAVWMWTAKEAILKATGRGLAAALDSVEVAGFPGSLTTVSASGASWTLFPFRSGASLVGALAWPRGAVSPGDLLCTAFGPGLETHRPRVTLQDRVLEVILPDQAEGAEPD